MLGFTPFKKHANKFNYVPRYYDPEKEAREERRAELRGTRREDADREYRPGQYIRTQREARAARMTQKSERSLVKIILGIVIVALVIFILVPRLAEVFSRASRTSAPRTEQNEVEEFNPYAPITVVPNDYKEEE